MIVKNTSGKVPCLNSSLHSRNSKTLVFFPTLSIHHRRSSPDPDTPTSSRLVLLSLPMKLSPERTHRTQHHPFLIRECLETKRERGKSSSRCRIEPTTSLTSTATASAVGVPPAATSLFRPATSRAAADRFLCFQRTARFHACPAPVMTAAWMC